MKNIKKKNVKRLTRRGLSLLLALIMCLGMIQTTAFAAEGDVEIVAASDEDTSYEDVSDEDASDEDTSYEDVSDEDASDEDTSTEVTSDADTSYEDTSDEVTSDADTSYEDTSDEVMSDTDTSDEAAPDVNTSDEAASNVETSDEVNPDEDSPAADGIIADAAVMGAPAADTLAEVDPVGDAAEYATIEEFMSACDAMSEADDMDSTLAALSNIEAIYNRLSDEDKAAVAEAWAYVQSYRKNIEEGNQDKDIQTLVSNFSIKFYVCCPDKGISDLLVGTDDSVSRPSSGPIQVSYRVPLLSTLTSVNYGRVTEVTSNAYAGAKSEGQSCDLSRNNPDVTFRYYVTDWDTGTTTPTDPAAPSGPYVTVVHEYYTNGTYDGNYTEYQSVTAPTYNVPKTIYTSNIMSRHPKYNGKTYVYNSMSSNPSTVTVKKGATGHQGTFTLKYNRTIAENVTLTYHANGGSNPPAAVTQKNGTEFIIKGQETMTRRGYNFLGWSTSRSASSGDIEPGNKMTLNSNTTLYAVWEKDVALIYDANGGSNPPKAVTTNKGTIVEIKGQENMTRADYEFLGWDTDRTATKADWKPGDKMTLNSNTTLYAVWREKAPTYNYTLNYNANTPDGVKDEDVRKMPGTQTSGSISSTNWSTTVSETVPELDGYTFAGWYLNQNGTGTKYGDKDSKTIDGFTPANPTRTLYAQWTKNPGPTEYSVTVRYEDENGNEIRSSETSSTTDGGKYDVTGKKVDSINGYKFKEVRDGSEGILKGTTDKDITITLIYTADSGTSAEKAGYKIVHEYYTNGARDSISIPDDVDSAEVGSRITVSDSMKKLTAGGNSYSYTSASAPYIILDSDASKNVIILRYDRTTGGGNEPEPTPNPTPNQEPDPAPNPTPDPVTRDDEPGSGGTEPETSGEEPAAAEIPNQQLPLAQTPVEQPRLLEITDEQPPLARIPGGNGALVEILDEEVPLAAVPKTGDLSGLWYAAVILSAAGLMVLALMERRAKK